VSLIRLLFLRPARDDNENSLPLNQFAASSEIDGRLRASGIRGEFDVRESSIDSMSEVQETLLTFQPHIVHSLGVLAEMPSSFLSKLFEVLGENIRCVILAPYDEDQAKIIANVVECVITLPRDIPYRPAIEFAFSFYQGLVFGKGVKESYEGAMHELARLGFEKLIGPRLISRSGTDPSRVIFEVSSKLTPEGVVTQDNFGDFRDIIVDNNSDSLHETSTRNTITSIVDRVQDIFHRLRAANLTSKSSRNKELSQIGTSINDLKKLWEKQADTVSFPKLYSELLPVVKRLLIDSEGSKFSTPAEENSLSLLLIKLYSYLKDFKIFSEIHDESQAASLNNEIQKTFSAIISKLDSTYQALMRGK
jgi:hypothetical protein